MPRPAALVALSLLMLAATPAAAAGYVLGALEFRGNERTKDRTMSRELEFRVGDTVTDAQVEDGRQSIMNLGLFKTVEAELVPEGDAHRLVITVDEKFYWLVVPRLDRSGDGDITYGAEANLDNLFGLNHNLEIRGTITDRQDSDVEREQSAVIDYVAPRLWGSPYELRFDLEQLEADLDEERDGVTGEYERELVAIEVEISRWIRERGPSRGWRAGLSARHEDYDHVFLRGDPTLFFDAEVVTLGTFLELTEITDHGFSRTGKLYRYDIDTSNEDLDSDGSFTRHQFLYRRYLHVTERPHTNFNVQFKSGATSDTVFGDPGFSIGGARLLRGYDREEVEGDAYVLLNLEFLRPVFGRDSLRGALFADAGNAYRNSDDVDLGDMRSSVGFGLRWKIRALVRVDLRLDVAHGFGDGGETKVYAATRATF